MRTIAGELGKLAGGTVLSLALFAALGWPALAMILAAARGPEAPSGGGLMVSLAGSPKVMRPLGLALETVRLVVATEAIALPLGLALALLVFRTDLWGRRVLIGLAALMAFVPMPLHAIAWIGAFGNLGRAQLLGSRPLLVGWWGAAFVHAMAALSWVVLLAGIGLRTVEPQLEEAALFDWPAWRVLLGVTLRRGLGAIAAAALAVAVLTAGDMTVTDLLVVRTYAEEAYTQFQLGQGPSAAAAVALPPLVVLGLLVVVAARGLLRADPARLPSPSARPKLWRLGWARVPLGVFALLTAGNAIALPVYGMIWRAGRVGGSAALGRLPHWSWPGFAHTIQSAWADIARPLVTSMIWAAAAACCALVLAWPLAWLSRRAGVWRWAAVAAVALALAVPGPVAGMALVMAYNAAPPIKGASPLAFRLFHIRTFVYDTPAIIVLACVLRTLPYAILVLWPALRALPQEYLDAATVEGCGPLGRVRRVGLPLTVSAAAAAWFASFVIGLGELPAVNLVSPPGATPLSVRVWSLLHTGVASDLAGVGLVMLSAIAIAGALAASLLVHVFAPARAARAGANGLGE